jgi:hypothetical protein
VRELENVIERASSCAARHGIGADLLDLARRAPPVAEQPRLRLDEALDRLEREMILRALEGTKQVKARAARVLGISERSLWYKCGSTGSRETVVLRALVAALVFAGAAHASGGVAWTPGEGAFLPGSLWWGGDLNFGVEIPEEGRTGVEIDHLSILARWEPTSRFSLFLDLRVDRPCSKSSGARASSRATSRSSSSASTAKCS